MRIDKKSWSKHSHPCWRDPTARLGYKEVRLWKQLYLLMTVVTLSSPLVSHRRQGGWMQHCRLWLWRAWFTSYPPKCYINQSITVKAPLRNCSIPEKRLSSDDILHLAPDQQAASAPAPLCYKPLWLDWKLLRSLARPPCFVPLITPAGIRLNECFPSGKTGEGLEGPSVGLHSDSLSRALIVCGDVYWKTQRGEEVRTKTEANYEQVLIVRQEYNNHNKAEIWPFSALASNPREAINTAHGLRRRNRTIFLFFFFIHTTQISLLCKWHLNILGAQNRFTPRREVSEDEK